MEYEEINEYYFKVNTPCPSCGKKELIFYTVADGPDDYRKVYECKACGEIWD